MVHRDEAGLAREIRQMAVLAVQIDGGAAQPLGVGDPGLQQMGLAATGLAPQIQEAFAFGGGQGGDHFAVAFGQEIIEGRQRRGREIEYELVQSYCAALCFDINCSILRRYGPPVEPPFAAAAAADAAMPPPAKNRLPLLPACLPFFS